VLITVSFGWLVAGPLRPPNRLTAFGFAAACGLIASVVSFLFIGPFEAVRGLPIAFEQGTTIQVRGHNAVDIVEYYRSRVKSDEEFELYQRRLRKEKTEQLQIFFTAAWTTMLSVLVFYLVLSLSSTAAATDPLASDVHRVARLGRYLEVHVPACLTVLGAVAVFFLETNQHISQHRGTSHRHDWSMQMIPMIVWLGTSVALARLGQARGWSAGVRVAIEIVCISTGLLWSTSGLLHVWGSPLIP
jgi:hypothetical protein